MIKVQNSKTFRILEFRILKLFVIWCLVFVIFPSFVSAWSLGEPIVPCGRQGTPACSFCHFVVLVDNLVQFLLKVLIFPIAVVALLVAGFFFITAGGNPGQIDKGKDIFKYAVLGIIIAFAAWVIVHLVLAELIDPKFIKEGNWFGFPGC